MAKAKKKPQQHTVYHRDGSIWGKGQILDGIPVGYWEWFRKEGTRMRSGTFDLDGAQTGEWTTYDRKGAVYKVSSMDRKKKGKGEST